MVKDFYAPKEIQFSRAQALWLIWHLPELREGNWPIDAASYDLYIGKRTKKNKAYFETPVEYGVEIQRRLERCGIDGLILEAIECWGKSEDSMATYFRMPVWSIRKRRKNALSYVASGPVPRWLDEEKKNGTIRKAETYQDFKDQKSE